MTDSELKCTYCQYTATSMPFLESHLESHRGEKLFQCRFCNYTTKYCGNRIVHERRMHLNKKPYKCKYCSYATVQSSTLHKHVAVHHSEMCTYKCLQCTFSCDDESRYGKHLTKHHTDMFTMNLKQINSVNRYAVRRSNNVVTNEGPSQTAPLGVSDIKIENTGNTEGEEKSTEKMNESGAAMEVDGTNQENGGELSQHHESPPVARDNDDGSKNGGSVRPVSEFNNESIPSKVAKVIKLYKCRYCEYSTKFATNRLIHERRHLGKKPYMCKYCDYAATQSTTLKTHLRQKHSQAFEKYHCNLCQFQCVLEDVFMKHLRDFHSDTAAVIDPNMSQAEVLQMQTTIVRSPYAISNVPTTYSMAGMSTSHQTMPMISTPNSENSYRGATVATSVTDYFADFNSLLNQTREDTDSGNPNQSVTDATHAEGTSQADNSTDVAIYASKSLPAIRTDESNVQTSPQTDHSTVKGVFPVSLRSGNAAQMLVKQRLRLRSEQRALESISMPSGTSIGTQTLLVLHDISTAANKKRAFQCQHCDIIFPDNVLFTIHRGFHGYEKPFQCNVCGHDCVDKYEFASHSHSCMP